MTCWMAGWMAGWMAEWMTEWMTDWLARWRGGRTAARPAAGRTPGARAQPRIVHALGVPRACPPAATTARSQSEKDAKLAHTLGQISVVYSCNSTGMHGPTCIFWANLTPFSLEGPQHCHKSKLHDNRLSLDFKKPVIANCDTHRAHKTRAEPRLPVDNYGRERMGLHHYAPSRRRVPYWAAPRHAGNAAGAHLSSGA
jgi:hypothetical protein